ncbi:MAG: hypothetical protein LBG17_02100 [Bacteroidales bacterium]|jgi:hypothetical protein|nr:hypothetical protein [Bacteroidales bacterium]
MEIVKIFCRFGELLKAETSKPSQEFTDIMQRAESKFPFFTSENIIRSLNAVALWLTEENLNSWLRAYPVLCENLTDKKIAVIMAGNIPFVGFHDVLCVLMAGHKAILKQSSNDPYLWKYLLRLLERVSPELAARVEITDGLLRDFDAVIATGSNNSARYFEEYFARVPHLIRKNRSSAAVLCGDESEADLDGLHDDIFSYFGLGCRNISHVFLPAGYDVQRLAFRQGNGSTDDKLKSHNAYMHNYEYSRTLALINDTPHIDTGYCLWIENSSLCSPIAVIYYSFYDNFRQVEKYILEHKNEIQCIAGNTPLHLPVLKFGTAQNPAVTEYADGIDTMRFCSKIINFTATTA